MLRIYPTTTCPNPECGAPNVPLILNLDQFGAHMKGGKSPTDETAELCPTSYKSLDEVDFDPNSVVYHRPEEGAA